MKKSTATLLLAGIICLVFAIWFNSCLHSCVNEPFEDDNESETSDFYSKSTTNEYIYDYEGYDEDSENYHEDEITIDVINYDIISTDTFVAYNDELCKSYRVVVDENATDEELKEVYNDIKSFDPITVWFYSDESLANGEEMYDIAMIDDYEILER